MDSDINESQRMYSWDTWGNLNSIYLMIIYIVEFWLGACMCVVTVCGHIFNKSSSHLRCTLERLQMTWDDYWDDLGVGGGSGGRDERRIMC